MMPKITLFSLILLSVTNIALAAESTAPIEPFDAVAEGIEAPSTDGFISDYEHGLTPEEAQLEPVAETLPEILPETPPETPAQALTDQAENYKRLSINYFNIFYGPSLKHPTSSQPDAYGKIDSTRPLLFKNFLSVGAALTENVWLSGTAYWLWRPVQGQQMSWGDPYLRLAHEKLISTGPFNLYGDVRVHFAVTKPSRDADLKTSLQSVQIATLNFGQLTLGTYSSMRSNIYGKNGSGYDAEFYLGPNINFQLNEAFTLSVLYEIGATHLYGDKPWQFLNDGSDLQPGVVWQVTPQLTINPYLNIYTSERISLASTSLGMTMSWQLL